MLLRLLQEGKFSEALSDTASYVKERQKIDAENLAKLQEGLAKSRARLMADLDGFFGKQDEGLEKALETVLDQASPPTVHLVLLTNHGSCVLQRHVCV